MEYSHVVVERLERGVSDHCPQLLQFASIQQRKSIFKFYNVIANHEDFQNVIRTKWGNQSSSCKLRDI